MNPRRLSGADLVCFAVVAATWLYLLAHLLHACTWQQ